MYTWNLQWSPCTRWEARIYEAGKQRFLGYYTSEVAAAKAYDARAVQLHGAAAKVNFPEEYEETRNSPPAVKPGYSLALQAGDGESPPRYKRKSPKNSSLNSATTRYLLPLGYFTMQTQWGWVSEC